MRRTLMYAAMTKDEGNASRWTFFSSLLVVPLLLDVIFGKVDAPFAEDLRDSPLTALDAIRDAYSSVAAAGEGKAGNLGTAILDQCDTVKVPERVLRHAEVPSEDSREERLRKRVKTQNVTELGEYRLHEFLVRTLQNLLVVRTTDETAQQHLARRCPARPLGGGVR